MECRNSEDIWTVVVGGYKGTDTPHEQKRIDFLLLVENAFERHFLYLLLLLSKFSGAFSSGWLARSLGVT
jgi:hypothetical protein